MSFGSGGSTAVVISWAREPDCPCGDADDLECIEGLGLGESAAIERCWGETRVWAAECALALSYLVLVGSFGALVGLAAAFGRAGRRVGEPASGPEAPPSALGIFLSYRRADSAAVAGRIHDRLSASFAPERVLKDVDSIDPGADFRERIVDAIERCDVLLAIVGPGWATAADAPGRRRLDDPADLVRLEIATALARSSC